jgi:hypothetical protein
MLHLLAASKSVLPLTEAFEFGWWRSLIQLYQFQGIVHILEIHLIMQSRLTPRLNLALDPRMVNCARRRHVSDWSIVKLLTAHSIV